MHIVWRAVIGLIAGWATGKVMNAAGYGVLMDIVTGISGALLAGFIMRTLGFPSAGLVYSIVAATVGAAVLTATVRFFVHRVV